MEFRVQEAGSKGQGKQNLLFPMTKTTSTLIAPCGMNCSLCRAYVKEINACPGCRGDNSLKPKTRVTCGIKTCGKIIKGGIKYCFSCSEFPCKRLISLDDRYREKYGMSEIENLMNIKKFGIRKFVRNENDKWRCPGCGKLLCVHEPRCLSCRCRWRN